MTHGRAPSRPDSTANIVMQMGISQTNMFAILSDPLVAQRNLAEQEKQVRKNFGAQAKETKYSYQRQFQQPKHQPKQDKQHPAHHIQQPKRGPW